MVGQSVHELIKICFDLFPWALPRLPIIASSLLFLRNTKKVLADLLKSSGSYLLGSKGSCVPLSCVIRAVQLDYSSIIQVTKEL